MQTPIHNSSIFCPLRVLVPYARGRPQIPSQFQDDEQKVKAELVFILLIYSRFSSRDAADAFSPNTVQSVVMRMVGTAKRPCIMRNMLYQQGLWQETHKCPICFQILCIMGYDRLYCSIIFGELVSASRPSNFRPETCARLQ